MSRSYSHIAITSLLAIACACSAVSSHKVLNVFFDGVPPIEDKTLVIGDTLSTYDSARSEVAGAAQEVIQYDYHPPYVEKKCGSCHDETHMGQLVMEEPDLCFSCHDEQSHKESSVHGPFGSGYCTACHRPHLSEEKKLLVRSGRELCFVCHSQETFRESTIHKAIKNDKNCLDCHDPHTSENNFMLAEGQCYSCHEDKIADYSFLHGPVSSNYCSGCHTSHDAGTPKLLIAEGRDLCLNCHSESTLYLKPAHKVAMEKNCLDCHNPHGGENQFMMN